MATQHRDEKNRLIAGGWNRSALAHGTPQQLTLILQAVSRRARLTREVLKLPELTANNRQHARTAVNNAERVRSLLMRNDFASLLGDEVALQTVRVALCAYAREAGARNKPEIQKEALETLRHVRGVWCDL